MTLEDDNFKHNLGNSEPSVASLNNGPEVDFQQNFNSDEFEPGVKMNPVLLV